ncbi:HipA domain-containing protein [Pelagibacterium lentulum]|uniref:Phosphatidylinositol kinase n=1 Tax=Pelagibacterium lentulum TaxID=2029865 RepID=A0A916RE54_9HYPH|nr:HipA domain-containing protein [Pelagibacterium lentulum]GGA54387.1 phosphatidylinositol kinase [Pelagibacterium lentulum]
MALVLDVRLDGFDAPIGRLRRDDRGDLAFGYADAYLARADALALSLSFPLADGRFGDYETRGFFDNLLPERDSARADIIARHGLEASDIAGILFHLGKDCPGAVSVLPEGQPPAKVPGELPHDYDGLDAEQLTDIVIALHRREPMPQEVVDPSPLAGVQSKIALTLLPNGQFGLPKPGSGAPTTHIIKVPDERHRNDARHEHHAMALSNQIGFPTAHTEIREIAGIEVLVITRYDRALDDEGRIVRRHQEDFCQALGLNARQKYERYGEGGRKFSAEAIARILAKTTDPASERLKFAQASLFDMLIGNVDGHAKNFSIFHLAKGRYATTPRYDVMPTMLDRNTTDEFAFRIGKADSLEAMTAADFDAFLADLGFSAPAGRRRIMARLIENVVPELAAVLDRLHHTGGKNFADLVATNIRTLCANMQLPVPAGAAQRDTFVR